MSDEVPWWYRRCTHSMYPLHHWTVLREVEGVAIVFRPKPDLVHIIVDLEGVGSACKTVSLETYENWSDPELLKYIQGQRRELRSLQNGP